MCINLHLAQRIHLYLVTNIEASTCFLRHTAKNPNNLISYFIIPSVLYSNKKMYQAGLVRSLIMCNVRRTSSIERAQTHLTIVLSL